MSIKTWRKTYFLTAQGHIHRVTHTHLLKESAQDCKRIYHLFQPIPEDRAPIVQLCGRVGAYLANANYKPGWFHMDPPSPSGILWFSFPWLHLFPHFPFRRPSHMGTNQGWVQFPFTIVCYWLKPVLTTLVSSFINIRHYLSQKLVNCSRSQHRQNNQTWDLAVVNPKALWNFQGRAIARYRLYQDASINLHIKYQ